MSIYQTIKATLANLLWKTIDEDRFYNNQCVDFVRRYAKDIGYPLTKNGNANWLWRYWLGDNWKITTTPSYWDIFVQLRWVYGHIWVFIEQKGNVMTVYEQNRDGKAYLNNNPNNYWSPVSNGTHIIRWDEVFYTPIVRQKEKRTYIKRKWYDFKKFPVLDQGKSNDCAGFAILACLIRMKNGLDYEKIARELIEEDRNEMTIKRASEWFIKKWYIKWIEKTTYSKFFLKHKPLITQIFNADWLASGKPPYQLQTIDREVVWSHWVCIGDWVIANSYWDKYWDKWYIYFSAEQKDNMKVLYKLVI